MATGAFAQSSPAQDVYNPGGDVLNVVSGGGPNHTPTCNDNGTNGTSGGGTASDCGGGGGGGEEGSSLPFTGFQAGLVGLAGLMLLGTGFAMRRVAREQA